MVDIIHILLDDSACFLVNITDLQIVLFVIADGASMHILTIPTFRKPRVQTLSSFLSRK